MLARVLGIMSSHTLLAGVYIHAAILEDKLGIPFKLKICRLLGSTKLLIYVMSADKKELHFLRKHFHTNTRILVATTSHLKIKNNLNVHHREITANTAVYS